MKIALLSPAQLHTSFSLQSCNNRKKICRNQQMGQIFQAVSFYLSSRFTHLECLELGKLFGTLLAGLLDFENIESDGFGEGTA